MEEPVTRRRVVQAAAGIAVGRLAVGALGAASQPAADAGAPSTGPAFSEQAHTDGLFRTVRRRLAFQARTREELLAWQTALRGRLHELLGLTAMKTEVSFAGRAEKVESLALDGYTREKWYLWTERDVPLPIWVLVPDKPAATPCPLVITPHGHNQPEIYAGIANDDKQRASIADGQRDITVQAVRQGYLAVLPTARGFGETIRPEDRKAGKVSSCRTGLMHGMLFGRTMIGYRVWDISRILDWLGSVHPFDPRRVAITGNSGGGTTSVFAPACEERITVAEPSCYFCTQAASVGSINHCECNYVPGLLREAELADVAGLIAPHPFQAIAGRTDPIFPLVGVKQAYEALRAIYRVAGVEERCGLHIGEGAHRYYSDGAWPFIERAFAEWC